MMRPTTTWGDVALARMDKWAERSHWLPEQEVRFPRNVFWGIFLWNFPILFFALGVIGFILYRSDPEPSGFTGLNWLVELLLGSLTISFLVDFVGCLWLRRAWNQRAKWLSDEPSRSSIRA